MVFGRGGVATDVDTAGRKGGLTGSITIAWDDNFKRGNIMWRVPRNIRWNDNIVVREDEIAVFYRDGKALAYLDRPDRYALTSQNAPIYGWLLRVFTGIQQQAEVYYLQKRIFDGKFGSKSAYQFRDKDFGMVNLRVFGEFRYRVSKPENFINQFVGTYGYSTSAEIEERLKEELVKQLYDALGEMKQRGLGVADLAANLNEIEQVTLTKSKDHFEFLGIEVQKISGLNINLPEEVQKAVDMKSSMTILGTDYMGYQAGQAMRDAARAPGGTAGAGVGLGAGMMMGYQMMQHMPPPQYAQPQQPQGKPCVRCGSIISAGTKFCPNCGAEQKEGNACMKCGTLVPGGMRFCPNCGTDQNAEKLQAARNYESALKYEEAAKIYEELGMWEEAGRVRRLVKAEERGLRAGVTEIKVQGDFIQGGKTEMHDSVALTSAPAQKVFKVCPYCGEKLDLPRIPKLCPYCGEKLQ